MPQRISYGLILSGLSLLPSEIRNLKFEEVNIENDPKYARIRITLRRLKWREEYRRNG
jgi:hypothetical protein